MIRKQLKWGRGGDIFLLQTQRSRNEDLGIFCGRVRGLAWLSRKLGFHVPREWEREKYVQGKDPMCKILWPTE